MFASSFVMLAMELDVFAIELGMFALEFIAFVQEVKLGMKNKLGILHKVNHYSYLVNDLRWPSDTLIYMMLLPVDIIIKAQTNNRLFRLMFAWVVLY